ncbi:MAG: pyridoxamine 5'-phosphate oxidase family protein [Devosia sp.]
MTEIETFKIHDEAELRANFGTLHPLAVKKCQPGLDRHARDFIALSPFMVLGTQGADGKADVSPRGDPPGFVHVIDDVTLAIPDRPGNNRLDSMTNIVQNPRVGLLFMIPGFDDTLRVNGTAVITTAPSLLSTLAVKDRNPTVAIVVSVDEVFLHCAKAFKRSKLWDSRSKQDRSRLPSLGAMILDQTSDHAPTAAEVSDADEKVETSYRKELY